LSKESAADCFQVRSLSQERLIKKIGSVDANTLDDIKDALKKAFSM
jgi:mRNA interferase MazF